MTRFKGDMGVMPDYSDSNGRSKSKVEKKPIVLPAKVATPRGIADVLQVISSILLRLLVFIFLRWIPARGAVPVIPTLYGIYVLSWLLHDIRFRARLRSVAKAAQSAAGAEDLKQLADNVDVQPEAAALKVEPSVDTNGSKNLLLTPVASQTAVEHIAETPTPTDLAAQSDAWPTVTGALSNLIFGVSTRSRRWNFWSLVGHTLLFAMFFDSFISPFLFPSYYEYNLRFARVGALGPTDAKIHIRYPHPLPLMDGLQEDIVDEAGLAALRDSSILNPEPLRIVWREASNTPDYSKAHVGGLGYTIPNQVKRWERGPLLRLTDSSDWTATGHIQNLWPATRYEWRLMFSHNSTFTPYPEQSRFFTTFPDPRLASNSLTGSKSGIEERNPVDDPNHFTFATSSCVKPDFPYHPAQFFGWNWLLRLAGIGDQPGGITQRNRIPGFDLMAERLLPRRGEAAIRFFLQLGDFIYADVPRVRKQTRSAFRQLYRNLYASSSFRRVYEHIPIIGIWDDHEFRNNWSGLEEAVKNPEGLNSSTTAWDEYIGVANPDPLDPGEKYYTFRYGDSAFFVLDTRKLRSPASEPDNEAKSMLGEYQKDALMRWLGAVNQTATFKFLISSVPFNTLWGGPLDWDGQHDTWSAYFTERQQILDVLQYVPNVIVLSGDRHEFASVGLRQTVTEFSTSPLSMFYLPVRTLSEENAKGPEGEEKLYKYIPDGNHKWTEFEVDTRDAAKPMVHATVVVDGSEAWKVTVVGIPVRPIPAQIGERMCSGKGNTSRVSCLLAKYFGLLRTPTTGGGSTGGGISGENTGYKPLSFDLDESTSHES
ncbi:hypothetical protein A4X09_0g4543 [Tilletia walkeri]|uniref:PhoD-like phosphatase metallophosphatase domain-containing protein n=1 Tax=Tilletia walkeri TaxID=117179 RepID=A0A8X7N8N4_9BASI|nr:hypothetical protein A4X09_0g4543 [Tilletia walkeri]